MRDGDITPVCPAIRIVAEEYDAFVRLVPDDEHLPRSYDEWLQRSARLAAERSARGENPKDVVIHSEEFAYFCLAQRREPSYGLLEELAAEKAART